MDEHLAFLQAILADPDDDAPRLVYADWLEERGDPRAEFIRAQCAANGLPFGDPERARLRKRAGALLARHEAEWVGDVPRYARSWRFRRGFVEQVTADAANCPGLFDLAPIRSLKARVKLPDLRSMLASRIPGRLRMLDLNESGLGDEGVALLAACPGLAGLARLSLQACAIGVGGARALAGSPHLSGLTFLGLSDNSYGPITRHGADESGQFIGDRGASALARSEHLGRLETLYVRACFIGDEGARALAESPRLANLTSLLIDANRVSGELARSFVPRAGLRICWGTLLDR